MTKELTKTKDLLTGFGKLFNVKVEDEDNDDVVIPESKYVGYMDNTSVIMLIPKTTKFKELLLSTFELEECKQKLFDTLTYDDNIKGVDNSCKFSCEYMKIVLAMCKHYETIRFSLKPDYPLKVETDDFIFILAPRVDDD